MTARTATFKLYVPLEATRIDGSRCLYSPAQVGAVARETFAEHGIMDVNVRSTIRREAATAVVGVVARVKDLALVQKAAREIAACFDLPLVPFTVSELLTREETAA